MEMVIDEMDVPILATSRTVETIVRVRRHANDEFSARREGAFGWSAGKTISNVIGRAIGLPEDHERVKLAAGKVQRRMRLKEGS